MDNTYIFSMREHLLELNSDLVGLSEINSERALSRYEYRAAERSLQVLFEACIGIAKHWSYAINKTAPADAYSAFEKLSQAGIIAVDNVPWKQVIDMRNALVHDYLNIDPEIIRLVIKSQTYKELFEFSELGLKALQKLIINN